VTKDKYCFVNVLSRDSINKLLNMSTDTKQLSTVKQPEIRHIGAQYHIKSTGNIAVHKITIHMT